MTPNLQFEAFYAQSIQTINACHFIAKHLFQCCAEADHQIQRTFLLYWVWLPNIKKWRKFLPNYQGKKGHDTISLSQLNRFVFLIHLDKIIKDFIQHHFKIRSHFTFSFLLLTGGERMHAEWWTPIGLVETPHVFRNYDGIPHNFRH